MPIARHAGVLGYFAFLMAAWPTVTDGAIAAPLGSRSGVAAAPTVDPTVADEVAALRHAMAKDVPGLLPQERAWQHDATLRAAGMLAGTDRPIDHPQLLVLVDRNPARQRMALLAALPGPPSAWQVIGAVRVSTGQAGRKDYYITPVGAFPHTDAILDFRAAGTFNEHHVRGLGLAGMRVWDFGWQWALKGWHTDGAGGDIRLQMHATDPDLLERRLGRPASEGCVRISSAMNRFLDHHGVLDADYEQAALQDVRYRALLPSGRAPSRLAGRMLVVIDTRLPVDTPPTAASRPPDWPAADLQNAIGEPDPADPNSRKPDAPVPPA